MNKPLKIAAIILIISAGLIGSYFFIKKSLTVPPVSISTENAVENNLTNQKSEKLINKPAFRWIKDTEEKSNQIQQVQEEQPSQQPNVFSEIKSKTQDFLSFLQPSKYNNTNKELLNDNDVSLVGEYYKKFLEALLKANFTNDELTSIKKVKEGSGERVFLLEELLEQAASGTELNDLRDSFAAWRQLDEKVLTELNKMAVDPKALYLHSPMIEWFEYHSSLAKKLSEENLSLIQINQLTQQFQQKAEIHNSRFEKSLSKLKKSKDFVLIPTVQAFTCGAFVPPPFYHFGGRVTLMEPCNWGIVETISLPCGGIFLFSYSVLAANPYLWKKPTIGSAILGRSTVAPGVCMLGVCPYCTFFPYEAIVLYFGTSLTP